MRRPDGSMISFLDVVLNSCLCFMFLLAIALATMSLKQANGEVEKPKAEFLVTVEWDPNRDADVDTWLQTPNGEILFFRKKSNEYAHIDHDDTGNATDVIRMPDGTLKVNPFNQEIATFRQACAGEWVVNVHLYRRDADERPILVHVRVLKLNPTVTEVADRTLTLANSWEEQTAVRVQMDVRGNILSQNTIYKPLVRSQSVTAAAPAQ